KGALDDAAIRGKDATIERLEVLLRNAPGASGSRLLDAANQSALAKHLRRVDLKRDDRFIWLCHYASVADGPDIVRQLQDIFQAADWDVAVMGPSGRMQHSVGIWLIGATPEKRALIVAALESVGRTVHVDEASDHPALILTVGAAA